VSANGKKCSLQNETKRDCEENKSAPSKDAGTKRNDGSDYRRQIANRRENQELSIHRAAG